MSPAEFDGWTPTETHEHYDADGNLTGVTRVTRDSSWTDEARDQAEALYLYPGTLCECGCGYPAKLTQDPSISWNFREIRCEYSRSVAMTQRHMEALQEKEQLRPVKGTPFQAYESDGVTWRLVPPGEE